MNRSELITINPTNISAVDIKMIAQVIIDEHLVVAPTETRYGLLARADMQGTVEKVCQVKGRDLSVPLALFVEKPEDLNELGWMNNAAQKLSDRFMPGPLTLVVKSRKDWSQPRVQNDKIGLRCSSTPLIKQLTAFVDFPISATSANSSGSDENRSISEIKEEFGDQIHLYVDGGMLTGPTSTVVDCTIEPVNIIREGAISTQEILETVSS